MAPSGSSILAYFLPWVLILGFDFWLTRRMSGGAGGLPLRSESRGASPEGVAAWGDTSGVLRCKVHDGETVVEDLIQGTVRVNNREIDDFVILKPNGDPIFHLAVVVDDGLMKISHVIRGDDHLTNATRHGTRISPSRADASRPKRRNGRQIAPAR